MISSNKSKRPEFLAITVVLLLTIFIFSPFVIYVTNVEQFTAPFHVVMKFLIIPVLALFLLLFICTKFISESYLHRITVLFAALSILAWFQGNVLVWDYGILDGKGIVWNDYNWQGWLDGIIWITAISAALFYYRKIGNLVVKSAFFIFLMQAVYVCYASYENWDQIRKSDYKPVAGPDKIFEFSSKQNILHIVSDGFQADVFNELMQHEKLGNRYQEAFKGFVFYRETLGAFPYTRFSIPAFLAGELYTNKMPKDEYVDSILKGDTIISVAKDAGYEIDLGTPGAYLNNRYSKLPFDNLYDINALVKAGAKVEDATVIMDLSLFRISPQILKRFVYNDQKWLVSQLTVSHQIFQFGYFRHTHFLNMFAKKMSANREAPVYKYIHVKNTHNPIVVNENCGFSGQAVRMNRRTLTIQSKCTLDTFSRLFNRMKETGTYDSTLIILHADHGGWTPNYRQGPPVKFKSGKTAPKSLTSLASPLLAIKQPGNTQEFRISDVHASLLDLPVTIADINNWDSEFKHKSLLRINQGEPRKRVFRFYFWQRDAWETDFTGPIQEFTISGSHYETEWLPGKVFYPPK